MNQTIQGDHLVLPPWLPFYVAATQREIGVAPVIMHSPGAGIVTANVGFFETMEEFRMDPSIFLATELLGTARILNETGAARELAEYVLGNPLAGPLATEFAREVLGGGTPRQVSTDHKAGIASNKARLSNFPRDAITWVEQARLYCIRGHNDKAEKSMQVALQLAPQDRFVVRAAIRLFVHNGKWDRALHIANQAYQQSGDPLIFGPLVSVATHLKKLPAKLSSIGNASLASPDIFLHAETLAALGALDLTKGADQRSKRFFKRAWEDPTKAVIGHSQWVLRRHHQSLGVAHKIDFSQSLQALSYMRFEMLDFKGSTEASVEWALEEPFSRAPYILATIAAGHDEHFERAAELAKEGLIANPKDSILINNFVFSKLRAGDVQSAEEYIGHILPLINQPEEIGGLATYGLFLMSSGRILEGSSCYERAIAKAVAAENTRLIVLATLNYMISLLDTTGTVSDQLLRTTTKAISRMTDPGCFGAALAISRRLQKRKILVDPSLGASARDFSDVTIKAASLFKASAQMRFSEQLPAQPKR